MLLYIDPGTGAMLFSLVIGLISVIWFGIEKVYIKIKYFAKKEKTIDENTDHLVIFSDHKRYWQTFEPIIKELNERKFKVTYLTMSQDDSVLHSDYQYLNARYIGKGSKAFTALNFLKADIVLSTTPGLDVYQWKRSKDVKWYANIPHGSNDSTTGYRSFGLDFYDAVMVSGEYQIDAMRKLENLRNESEKEAVMVGVPYMDEMAKRLKEEGVSISPNKITVLVAPTWGESSIFNRYGEDFIEELIKTEYQIILRPHPQSFTSDKELIDKLRTKYPNSEQIEWNSDADNFEVLKNSDIMISDYSGVIFDFAFVFDKPVICADTKMDTDPLDVWWIGEQLWAVDALPRIGPILKEENIKEIKEMIDKAINDKSYTKSRHEARDETWACQGEGAKKAVDYLINKSKTLRKENSCEQD